jgi:3-phosphoshikimate 1-carboxyvinyltransferase
MRDVLPDPLPVPPVGHPLDAVVEVPGSKSITNRALLAAALAEGTSRIDGALFAGDTEAMMECLRRLGAGVEADPSATAITVDGAGGTLPDEEVTLPAGQAGTVARFLLPVLATGSGVYRLEAHPQLEARPMGPGIEAARSLGATVEELGRPGHLPVVVNGGTRLVSRAEVAGSVSSQFLSGLLFAGPLLPDGLEVELSTELVSRPYVDMTAAVMASFGVEVTSPDPRRFVVPPAPYRAGRFTVEPDASAAAYFLAAAAICGGRVTVGGLAADSVQGDAGFADVLARMGAEVGWVDGGVVVTGPDRLEGIDVDLSHLSDLAPTVAVVAAFARSATRVRGIGFIRRKETDRVAAVVRELRRCGVEADEEDDGFVVRPGSPHGAVIEPAGDHRIAMAFALIGLRVPGVAVADPGCVAKTFPSYWTVLDSLRR